jgi:uracil phosphoribosyltransferase
MSVTARIVARSEVDHETRGRIAEFEARYDTPFDHFVQFDRALLASLHLPIHLPASVSVAAHGDPTVLDNMAHLTRIANMPEQSPGDQADYLDALVGIYGSLAVDVRQATADTDTCVVAPQREGRLLAERLGCLPRPRQGWTPQAKRISTPHGLLVALDSALPSDNADTVVLIDGVVATGVTLMAIMQLCVAPNTDVHLFTCHSTPEGAAALVRFAAGLGARFSMHVGDVSGVLNDKFYAVSDMQSGQLILGDVGDTISHLETPQ